MPLTDNQCKELRNIILNEYIEKDRKGDLKDLLKEFDEELELIISYSSTIENNKFKENLHINGSNQKVKILLLVIQSNNLNTIDEYNEIKSVVEESNSVFELLQPEFIKSSNINYISEVIIKKKPDIIHFCGHALTNGSLKFDDGSEVTLNFLEKLAQSHKDIIKCIFINACHSEKATETISQYIDYTVGIKEQIEDSVAINFARGFYVGLVNGNVNSKVSNAFNNGLCAIANEENLCNSKPILRKRVKYEDAISSSIKKIDANGKIDYFIKKIRDNNFTNSLCHIFSSYYLHPLRDYLNELKVICKEVDDNAIITAYKSILPNQEAPDNIIDELVVKDYTSNHDSLYIVKFVGYLVKNLENNQSNKLEKMRCWLKKIPVEFNLYVQNNVYNSSLIQDKIETYLFIKVDDEGDKLRLQAEVMKQGQKSEPLDLPGNGVEKGVTCKFEKIPDKINEYITHFDSLQNSVQTNITLELLLPMQYIDKNIFHDWLKNFSDTRIGFLIRNNKVRIHLRERTGKAYYPALKANWDNCKVLSKSYSNQAYLPEEKTVKIIEEQVNGKNCERVAEKLREKIGVKFYYNHKAKQREHFKAVLIAGTPLVFWTRCSHMSFDNMDCELKLKSDCLDNNFQEIIEQIHDFIRIANIQEKPKEHFGYHLGFLCDYPCDTLESWSLRE